MVGGCVTEQTLQLYLRPLSHLTDPPMTSHLEQLPERGVMETCDGTKMSLGCANTITARLCTASQVYNPPNSLSNYYPFSQMRKLMVSKVKCPGQGHTIYK